MVCPECGDSLDTPRLRELVQLPMEATETPDSAGWTPRHGVLTAGLLLAAVLAGCGGWVASQEPSPPTPLDVTARAEMVDKNLDQMSASDLWKAYYLFYEPLTRTGLQRGESPRDAALRAAITASRFNQRVLFSASAAVAVAAIGLFAAIGGMKS